MSNPDKRDPIEILGDLKPSAGWDQPVDLTADADAAQLLTKIIDGPISPRRSTRRRRRTITGLGVGIAMIAAGTAVAALWPQSSPTEATSVSCWSSVQTPPEQQVALGWDGVDDPVTMCQQQWDLGRFETPQPPGDLHACTSPTGIAVVVPGSCEIVGLPSFAPVTDPTVLSISDTRTLLGELLNTDTCLSAADAVPIIEKVLEEAGLHGWTIEMSSGARPQDTCATASLDPSTNSAFIPMIPPTP